jgi:predicted DCC family thiol-disulfide oxidoreductase YuxK
MILYFDDQCLLCNRAVLFLSKHIKTKTLYFAPIGGSTYQNLLIKHPKLADSDTVILEIGNQVYTAAEAIYQIIALMGWPFKICLIGKMLPLYLNNYLYHCIARNRHRISTKKNVCSFNHQIQILP